jgi:hypothetical protein
MDNFGRFMKVKNTIALIRIAEIAVFGGKEDEFLIRRGGGV